VGITVPGPDHEQSGGEKNFIHRPEIWTSYHFPRSRSSTLVFFPLYKCKINLSSGLYIYKQWNLIAKGGHSLCDFKQWCSGGFRCLGPGLVLDSTPDHISTHPSFVSCTGRNPVLPTGTYQCFLSPSSLAQRSWLWLIPYTWPFQSQHPIGNVPGQLIPPTVRFSHADHALRISVFWSFLGVALFQGLSGRMITFVQMLCQITDLMLPLGLRLLNLK
jgi:hypothetical protein